MPSLCRLQRKFHRFPIFEFTNRDYIGCLAQGRSHCLHHAWCVAVDLTLMDRGSFVIVKELDRVLDSDDVAGLGFVYAGPKFAPCLWFFQNPRGPRLHPAPPQTPGFSPTLAQAP